MTWHTLVDVVSPQAQNTTGTLIVGDVPSNNHLCGSRACRAWCVQLQAINDGLAHAWMREDRLGALRLAAEVRPREHSCFEATAGARVASGEVGTQQPGKGKEI